MEECLKMEQPTNAWRVNRKTGLICSGVCVPGTSMFVFNTPQGLLMFDKPSEVKNDDHDLVCETRVVNAPVNKAAHDMIMACLEEGVEPNPYSP